MCSDTGAPNALADISKNWRSVEASVKDCIITSVGGLLNNASKCRSQCPKYLRTKRQLKVEKAMKRMNGCKRLHKTTAAQGKTDNSVGRSSQTATEHRRSHFDFSHFLHLLECNKALGDYEMSSGVSGAPAVEGPLCQRIQNLRISHQSEFPVENAMIDFRKCVANELESRCPCADLLLAQRNDILSMIADSVYTSMALVAYKHCRINRAKRRTIMPVWDKYSYINRLNTRLRSYGLRRRKKTKSRLRVFNSACHHVQETAVTNGLDEREIRIKLEPYVIPTTDAPEIPPIHFSSQTDSIEWLLESPVQPQSRKRKCRTPNRHPKEGKESDPVLNGRQRHDVLILSVNSTENGKCETLSDSYISSSDQGSCGSLHVVGNALSESLNRLLVRARKANPTNNENLFSRYAPNLSETFSTAKSVSYFQYQICGSIKDQNCSIFGSSLKPSSECLEKITGMLCNRAGQQYFLQRALTAN